MRYPTLIPVILACVLALGLAFAGRTQGNPQIKHVPTPDINMASGVDMWLAKYAYVGRRVPRAEA